MARLSLAILAMAATAAVASPVPDADVDAAILPPLQGEELIIDPTIVRGPALAPNPTPPPIVDAMLAKRIASPPKYLTITVVNKNDKPISTVHAHEANGPNAVSGNVGAGTMAVGATAAFAVPTNWAGNVQINDASFPVTGDVSMIEANFKVPSGYSVAVADVDISYVNGFSVAIVCKCDGASSSVGCNKNLFGLNSCANKKNNCCINPLRSDTGAKSANTFFKPCQGGAYTYVNDHNANSFGECQSGRMTCCVGTKCAGSSRQP